MGSSGEDPLWLDFVVALAFKELDLFEFSGCAHLTKRKEYLNRSVN
jgi:hypothetical protein